jgi:hypothetical protein
MINCIGIPCLPNCSEWIIFFLGILVTICWALIIYSFRPKLKIGLPKFSDIDNRSIVIPITNQKKYRKATRLKIEVAVVKASNTYHLITDNDDFAFLNSNDNRSFKAYDLNSYLISVLGLNYENVFAYLNEQNTELRIRIHATDSFSGLGKTFEEKFEAIDNDYKNKGFRLISNK